MTEEFIETQRSDMAKDDLTSILEAAKKDFQGKNIIAFIGKPKSGKTVVSGALFDALNDEFIKKYGKNFFVKIKDGHDDIDRIHRRMFTKGRFPPATLPNTRSIIKIELTSRAQLGTKVEFMLRDASGEDIQKIMEKRYEDPEELIRLILTKHKGPSDPYGPLSYILFTKIFVILLDCNLAPEWKTEQIRYSQIITSICDMKEHIDETVEEKINNPIAIVLTKSDELKNKELTPKLKPNISNKELLETYLPLLQSNLESTHMGKLRIFKFNISGVQEASEIERQEIIKEEVEELNQFNQEFAQKKLESAKKRRGDLINSKVKQAMNKTREQATKENQPPEEIERRASEAGKAEKTIAEGEYPMEDFTESSEMESDEIDVNAKRYTIDMPVKYSQTEYIRFISWLIDRMS